VAAAVLPVPAGCWHINARSIIGAARRVLDELRHAETDPIILSGIGRNRGKSISSNLPPQFDSLTVQKRVAEAGWYPDAAWLSSTSE